MKSVKTPSHQSVPTNRYLAGQNQATSGTSLLLILFFLIIIFSGYSQVPSRQESNFQLKKAVYSGNPSQFSQIYDNYGTYYAVIPIPELNVTNMPNVSVWVRPTSFGSSGTGLMSIAGWVPADYSYRYNVNVILTNGACLLGWSSPGGYDPTPIDAAIFTNFLITVIYEDVPTNSSAQLLPLGQIQITATNNVSNGAYLNLKFTTQTNSFYYIQASTNLSTWMDLDGPFLGNGSLFLKTYSTTNQSKQFYRFRQSFLETW